MRSRRKSIGSVVETPSQKRSAPVTVRFSAGIQFTTNCEAVIMAEIVHFGLTAAAAFILATCGGNGRANNANAGGTPEMNASAEPAKVALMTLEKNAYEAWKSKDAKFWATFLSDKFAGWGSSGKLDKASATKEY